MQIVIKLLLIVMSNFLFASDVSIKSGWQLLGAKSKITDMSIFDKAGIIGIFSYKDSSFISYPKDASFELIHELLGGDGYWLNASNDLTLSFDDSAALEVGAIYGVNVVKGWRLLGALQDLCVNHIFNDSSIKSVWAYDINSEWKQYTPVNIDKLTQIAKGRGYWVNSISDLQLIPYIEISGNIVDGYIKDARLKISSLDTGKILPFVTAPTTLNAITSLQSKENGGYKVYINSNSSSAYVIRTVGGDDKSSGEIFEGILKGVVANLGCSEVNSAVRHISPISSIVTKIFSDAQKATKSLRTVNTLLDDTEKRVALLFGVDKGALISDPIELLQSNAVEDKNNAAKLLRGALIVEKVAEAIAKSVTDASNVNSIQKSIEIAMDGVAKSLGNTTTDFNSTMLDITTLIDNSVLGFSNQKSKEKLDSVKDILMSTTQFVLNIDEEKYKSADALNQIEITQKAIELVTSKIEQKLQNVAISDSNFTALSIEAKNVVKAISISGGVGGTRALVKSQIDRLAVQNQKLDISDFTDKFLDDVTVAQKSKQYNDIFGDDISIKIISAASIAFKEIIEKKILGEVVDGNEVAQIIAKNISSLEGTTQQSINNKTLSIKDSIASDVDVLISKSKSISDEVVLSSDAIKSENWLEEAPQLMSWQGATSFCASSLARLPTLVELTKSFSIKIDGFNSVHFYWSSTEDSIDSNKALRVFFDSGASTSTLKSDNSFVRCIKL